MSQKNRKGNKATPAPVAPVTPPVTEPVTLARGDKANAIREMIGKGNMGNKEIAMLLTAKGIPTSSQDVANMKNRLRLAGQSPATVTSTDLVAFKQLVASHGGLDKLTAKVEDATRFLESIGDVSRFQSVREQYQALIA